MRVSKLCSAFAAALIAFAPTQALAQEDSVSVQDRPRPEYDPVGRTVGGFNLNASLGLSAETTDNLFATDTGEQDDVIVRVNPEARLSSNWIRHSFTVAAGAEFSSYSDFSSENAETGYVNAAGRIDIGSRSSLNAAAFASNHVESRSDPDALVIASAPVEYTRSGFSAGASHSFNRIRLTGRVASSESDYDDVGAFDQDYRDVSEKSATGRVEWAFSERIYGVVSATADEREYDLPVISDSDGRTYLAGVRLALTNLMQGEITVGQYDRSYDDGSDIEGTAVAANLEWYATRLTTVTLDADRRVVDAGASTISPFVAESYGVRVDHELLRNLIVSGSVEMSQNEFEDIDRSDDYMRGTLEARYLVNRRFELNARFEHEENSSDGLDAYRDYEVNRFLGGVRIRL